MSSWRGWGVSFSDGMCTACSIRTREEWNLPPAPSPAAPPARRAMFPAVSVATAALALAVTVTFGLLMGPPALRLSSLPPGPATIAGTPSGGGEERTVPPVAGARQGVAQAPAQRLNQIATVPPHVAAASGEPGRAIVRVAPAAARGRVARARGRAVPSIGVVPASFSVARDGTTAAGEMMVAARDQRRSLPLWVASLTYVELQAP